MILKKLSLHQRIKIGSSFTVQINQYKPDQALQFTGQEITSRTNRMAYMKLSFSTAKNSIILWRQSLEIKVFPTTYQAGD